MQLPMQQDTACVCGNVLVIICLANRPEPILLFFPPIFLSSNSFFSYLFCSIFCSLFSYFPTHKRFLLVYLQLLSMHDCCIRVIHNMVIALLEYLDLLAVFQKHMLI